jgi:hypothetical protein
MRSSLLPAILCAVALPVFAQSSSFQLHGFITARGVRVKAQPSWTEAGFGRFDVGAASPDDHRTVNIEVAQLGADWTPTSWLALHADGLGRREPSGTKGRRAGLVQAYADLYNDHWRLRLGNFWLPTSRENTGPLWTSPYTITYSALNTWIGEEFRPTGADLQFSPNFYLAFGATAFRGNDTTGTEIAARGWTLGNRLTVYNEPLPLPPPDTTTKPITHDLDHQNGYAERIRLQLPERAMLQVAHIDNRAEMRPEIDGQTPWRTRFNVVGATVGPSSPTTVSAEWSSGSTAVGFPGGSYKLDFEAAYVLLSRKAGPDRWTARFDRFSTKSDVRQAYDSSYEKGHAITVAWLHDVNAHLRAGVEYARVKGDRVGLEETYINPDTGGSTITVELRYGF